MESGYDYFLVGTKADKEINDHEAAREKRLLKS